MAAMPKQPPAEKIQAYGAIGEVKVSPTKNPARQMFEIPLHWPADEPVAKQKVFTARLFLDPDWLDESFDPDTLEDNELQQYNINFQGKFMKLLRSVFGDDGKGSIEDLEGQIVGFTAKPRKDEPSQLEIGTFYEMKDE